MLVALTINGDCVEVNVPAHWTLLEVLRDHLRLTGTRAACDMGDCGSCAVLIDGVATLSCLTLAQEARGRRVTTVEGLSWGEGPHPIQQAFQELGASQCGFCTPGFVVTTTALLGREPDPTEAQIREALSGNLCRCTGYSRIVQAVKRAAQIVKEGGCPGAARCAHHHQDPE